MTRHSQKQPDHPTILHALKAARLLEATRPGCSRSAGSRRLDAERVLGILRQPAITVANGVTEAAVLHLRSLVARLRLANREFHQAERKLDELCTTLRDKTATPKSGGPCDAAVLSSLPGIGTVTLATLLTEAAGPIKRRDYAALKTLSGVAPVTKRSGKSCVRHNALRRPGPVAQCCVPLGARGRAERPHVRQPLRRPTGARPILRPRPRARIELKVHDLMLVAG